MVDIVRLNYIERVTTYNVTKKMLVFGGNSYRTIADLNKQFKVSEKTLKNMIKRGEIREPKVEVIGTRRFRYFDDAWIEEFRRLLAEKNHNDGHAPSSQ